MATAADVLAVAVREIGTVEQSGNRQKYGKAYGMDGVYWCMQFVWWCFQQADKTLFMDGGKTASCGERMRWAQAHGRWVTKGYRPGDVLIYDCRNTKVKTDHCGICESVSGQYVTAIEGNTSNGNTGSQSNGDGVYRRKRKLSLVLGAYRPKYTDYRAQLQKRAGLEDKTMDYLAAYKYGSDLIRKLATMKSLCPNRARKGKPVGSLQHFPSRGRRQAVVPLWTHSIERSALNFPRWLRAGPLPTSAPSTCR